MTASTETRTTWPLLASGISLIAVCYGLARFAYGLFVPSLRAAFGLSDTLLGTIGAGSYAGYCAAIVISAIAVPRFGARQVAVSAGVVAATGMLVVASAPNGGLLAIGVLVAGASTGVASPPLAEAISCVVPASGRDRAQAFVNAGTGVGIAVSGPVALLAAGNWRLAWATFAAMALLVTWWVARTTPPRAPRSAVSRQWADELIDVATDRRSAGLAVGAVLFGVTSSGVWTFGRDHLADAAGLTEMAANLLWIILGIAGLVGIVTGDLGRRWGLRRLWRGTMLALAGSSATLGMVGSSLVGAALSLAIFGSAYIVLTAVILLWAVRLHPQRTAAAVAFGFLLLALGQALAAPVVGALVGIAGTSAALLVCFGIGVGAHRVGPR